MSLSTFAASPTPEAVTEYHAAVQAISDGQRVYNRMTEIVKTGQPVDPVLRDGLVSEVEQTNNRLNVHLDNAIAAGHAVAMYQKAKLLLAASIIKNKEPACELYGRAAEQGLMAGAVEYAKCLPFYPPTTEYSRRLSILQTTVEGQDFYQSEYPLLTAFPFCFPKHKPALQPGEDALQWVVDNARPQALSSENFRAEGYYVLAMGGTSDAQIVSFLNSAFEHGCREDSARVARMLKDDHSRELIRGPGKKAVQ
ncbi:hypothetical protein J3D54_005143 [Pseudomonas sp. GGS8]|uniref:hypothetical protein n=1 Tax=Pseudomonas sp. GGS8 TaxID=2817892 RepID=UPI00209D9047|nr:hypothetical protein [Pseudomonas sp. GGS8]MCP1446011.1 hypothetical protein [Pseudomonas sp. GGS8]